MDQDSHQRPRKRLRNILSNPDGEMDAPHQPQDQPGTQPPPLRLPERRSFAPQASSPARENVPSQESVEEPVPAQPDAWPADAVQILQESRQKPPPPPASPFAGLKFGPAFWTVTGILSLVVNVILIAVLLGLLARLDQLQSLQGRASNVGATVLGGLYSNFEKMDRATIKTVIPVDARIPLSLTVPVKTTTQITLADSATIPSAHVTINTGGLSIDSDARVTLPAGTPLTVNLDFELPVEATIPVHLEVPVNIPMAETELHEPFVGLQQVVLPWYCMVEPNAFSLNGYAICR